MEAAIHDLTRTVAPFDLAFYLFDLESREVEIEIVDPGQSPTAIPSVIVDADLLLDSWFATDDAQLAALADHAFLGGPAVHGRLAVPLILATGLIATLAIRLASGG